MNECSELEKHKEIANHGSPVKKNNKNWRNAVDIYFPK